MLSGSVSLASTPGAGTTSTIFSTAEYCSGAGVGAELAPVTVTVTVDLVHNPEASATT